MNIITTMAEVVIAACASVALWQIKIAKDDVKTRSKREAITLAITQVEYYRSAILASLSRIKANQDKVKPGDTASQKNETKIFYSRMELDNFTLEELKEKGILNKFLIKLKAIAGEEMFHSFQNIANKMEYFSLAFTSGAADESVAFNPTADTFCRFVEEHYEIYCFSRKNGNYRYFNSTIELYKIWKSRIMKNQVDFKEATYNNEIREDLNKIKKENLKTIDPVGI